MAIWPFSRNRTFLEADDEDWHLACWGWLLARFGEDRFKQAPLVTASVDFFPLTQTKGQERAEYVFDRVRRLAGMADWPATLEEQAPRPNTHVSKLGIVKIDSGHKPLGTFSRREGAVVITYDPALLQKPIGLIATLAHEIAHYLLHLKTDLPPGGETMEEFATDLATVYLGFGLFTADQAFNFRQFSGAGTQGWQTSGAGYLRERDWAFALAVFCSLREEDVAALKPWMKPYLFKDTKAAARYLAKTPKVLETLRGHQAFYAVSESEAAVNLSAGLTHK